MLLPEAWDEPIRSQDRGPGCLSSPSADGSRWVRAWSRPQGARPAGLVPQSPPSSFPNIYPLSSSADRPSVQQVERLNSTFYLKRKSSEGQISKKGRWKWVSEERMEQGAGPLLDPVDRGPWAWHYGSSPGCAPFHEDMPTWHLHLLFQTTPWVPETPECPAWSRAHFQGLLQDRSPKGRPRLQQSHP